MKRSFVFLLCLSLSVVLFGQDISGKWDGLLKVQSIELRLVFHLIKTENGYTATMDSPDQGANGIPVSDAQFVPPILTLKVSAMNIVYEGTLVSDTEMEGTFTQMGNSFPMHLTKSDGKEEVLIRPQEPKPPFPYATEEVTFKNDVEGFDLAGTLTLPNKVGVFPAVVLISGSGQQNRDEEIFGHKPFLVLADHLTKNGIAVLRYDDRGTGASKGNFKASTTKDFAMDAASALNYLKTRKEIDKGKIGLIGHSEGGIIAPMVAIKSNDIAFMVLMAGTAIPGDELLLLQQRLIAKAYGTSETELDKADEINKGAYQIIKSDKSGVEIKTELASYFARKYQENASTEMSKEDADKLIKTGVDQLTSPWMSFFITYDPAPTLGKVKCPVLAINGSKDLQVPPKENLSAIKMALQNGGNMDVTTQEIPRLNHMFQECETGTPLEYSRIEQTFAPVALNEISSWILKETK